MLKLRRNKKFINALGVLSVVFFAANAAYALSRTDHHRLSYRTQLGFDLDGDHIPETASVRHRGEFYQVSIHFTTGRPKLRLTTYVTEVLTDLSVETRDVNDDNREDVVIISATSVRPIGVWLNQGKAKFQRVNSWFYGSVGKYTGPTYRHHRASGPEPVGNICLDRLPQMAPPVHSFIVNDVTAFSLPSQTHAHPFDRTLQQVAPRGPPARARV